MKFSCDWPKPLSSSAYSPCGAIYMTRSSTVSIQTHATQALALRALHAMRKWKMQATEASWLAAAIVHSYWLPLAFVAWKIESVLSLRFLTQGPLASVVWLALAYFCFFCLRNFLAFIAFLEHFLFCLRTFSYARPCVRCVCCVRLNGNWASVSQQTVRQRAHSVVKHASTAIASIYCTYAQRDGQAKLAWAAAYIYPNDVPTISVTSPCYFVMWQMGLSSMINHQSHLHMAVKASQFNSETKISHNPTPNFR